MNVGIGGFRLEAILRGLYTRELYTHTHTGAPAMAVIENGGEDSRTTKQVMAQWRKLQELKRSLVRDGLADGDTKPADLLKKVREAIPSDLFA